MGIGGGVILEWLGHTTAALVTGILLFLIGVVLLVYGIKLQEKKQTATQFSRKEQAYKELADLIKLGQELWEAKEKIPEEQDAFKDAKVKDIFMRIQQLRCLPENQKIGDSELEVKLDSLVGLYRRFVEFHFEMYSPEMLAASDQLNAWIKEYIRRNIKD
jgi:hypothetical protein